MPYFKLPHTAVAFGLILCSGHAFAADLDVDPAYADVPAPIPQQQVTFGSGWYVRGDIAAVDGLYKVDVAPTSDPRVAGAQVRRTKDLSYGLSLGGGYAFTNQFRTDITADFNQPSSSKLDPVVCPLKKRAVCGLDGRFEHYDALINGYYDIGTWAGITPYVGAGVGVGFGGVHSNITNDRKPESGYLGYHSFAWALMAGATYDIIPHVKLDVGYRYLNEGRVLGVNIYQHQVRAGVRYMIDN